MKIQELNGKNVCILGYGREGKSVVQALGKYAPSCEITIADKNESIEVSSRKHWLQIGSGWLHNLEKFDVIIKSPGIPPNDELWSLKDKVTSATQIFLDTIAETGATVIGVTGSKGKSTTSSLIYEILKAAGKDVHLIGNIGKPSLDYLEFAKPETIFVMEMSSYQLMDLKTSPSIAVLTSFFPEHLDYHGSLENYKEAKSHIAKFQTSDDTIFFAEGFAETKEIADLSPGKKLSFSAADAPLAIENTKLLGTHNLSNIAGAWKVCESLGVEKEIAINVMKEFHGLPHRLQSLGVHHGIEWIDDAISTTPESAIAALDALGNRVETIILGGQDRGNDFSLLAKRILASGIRTVILFPESGQRIRDALGANGKIEMSDVTTMEEAVAIAKDRTSEDGICLLSPASPSYNMYKNFEEKGEMFKKEILA